MHQDTHTPITHCITGAGKRLGVSRSTMYKLLSSGELKGFNLGDRVLIPESELQRFVAAKMEAAA